MRSARSAGRTRRSLSALTRARTYETRAIPASAHPASSASSPKPSTGPSAPVPCSPPAAAVWAPQARMPAGQVVAVDALQAHVGQPRPGGVVGLGQRPASRWCARRGVGAAGRALDEARERRSQRRRARPGTFSSGAMPGRDRAHRLGRGAEPAQVDVDVAQGRGARAAARSARSRPLTAARPLARRRARTRARGAPRARHEPPAAPGEAGREHHAGGARARAAAHRRRRPRRG